MLNVALFMCKPTLPEQVQHRVPVARRRKYALRHLCIELSKVSTRKVVDQVAGPKSDLSICYFHRFFLHSYGNTLGPICSLYLTCIIETATRPEVWHGRLANITEAMLTIGVRRPDCYLACTPGNISVHLESYIC